MTASRRGVRKMTGMTVCKRGVTKKNKTTKNMQVRARPTNYYNAARTPERKEGKHTDNNVARTPEREEMITVSKDLWDAMNKRMEDEEMLRMVMQEQITNFRYYYKKKFDIIIGDINELKEDLNRENDGYAEEIQNYEIDHGIPSMI
jgi:hypothetical protein